MKKYAFLYTIYVLFSSLYAEELQSSVQKLIQQVKNAKVDDRRQLMNQLKVELRNMNKESRHSAMVELKKSFSKEHHVKNLYKQHGKYKNAQKQQCTHQPKYRHLKRQNRQTMGQGQRGGNGNTNGHK